MLRRRLIVLTSLALSLCIPFAARWAEAQTLNAAADSYLRGASPDTNEGASSFLRIESTGPDRALVRFDQATIASTVGAGTLQSASLELFIEVNDNNWGTGSEVDVHRVTTDWTESGVTWNCAVDSDCIRRRWWSSGSWPPSPRARCSCCCRG